MDRRAFILRSGSTLAAVSTPVLTPLNASAVVNAISPTDKIAGPDGFTERDWITIAAVQNHLFPSESEAPGAIEINALRYLHDFLSNPATDPSDVKFILSGVHSLQAFAQQNKRPALGGNDTVSNGKIALSGKIASSRKSDFIDLSIEHREVLLRDFEKQANGRRWLVTILNYILEALLTDPVYGGNPDGIGWKWLEHRAGEPRPPANKRYWLL